LLFFALLCFALLCFALLCFPVGSGFAPIENGIGGNLLLLLFPMKAIFSVFSECGLRELLASLGVITNSQFSFLADCIDVRKSHHVLVEVAVAIESELFNAFVEEEPERRTQLEEDPQGFARTQFHFFSNWKKQKSEEIRRFSIPTLISTAICLKKAKQNLRVHMWCMFTDVVMMMNACWWGQRSCNWLLFTSSIKLDTGFLPFFSAWGRTHYQSATPAFLRDLGKLSDLEKAYLELGGALANITGKGHWTSLMYVTEVHNWMLKHYTPHLDASGEAWKRTSENFSAIIAIHECIEGLFLQRRKTAEKEYTPNTKRILTLAHTIKRWKVLGLSSSSNFSHLEAASSLLQLSPNDYWASLFEVKEPMIHEDGTG